MSSPPAEINVAGKAALLAAPGLSTLALAGLIPVLPQIQAHFAGEPNSALLTRLLITSVGVSMIFGAPVAGLLANRLGWRRMLTASLILYAIAGMAGAVIDDLWALLASRLLLGLTSAIEGTLVIVYAVTALEGERRNRWLGYITVAGILAGLVLVPLSGFLGSVSWRLPFLLHALAIPVLLVVLAGVPELRQPAAAGPKPARQGGRFPFVIVPLSLLCSILGSTSGLYTPFHLRDLGVSSPAVVSLAMLPASLVGAVLSIAFGLISKALSIRMIFAAAFLAASIGQLVIGMGATLATVVAGNVVLGLGIGLISPNLLAFAALLGRGAERARNIGLARAGLFAGPLVAQLALEPVVKLSDASGALIALGVLGLLTAAAVTRLASPSPQPV
jgi:MFS family permease